MKKFIIAVFLLMITSVFEPKAKATMQPDQVQDIEPEKALDTLATRINLLNQIKSYHEKP